MASRSKKAQIAESKRLDKKQVLKELYRCKKDPLYFINNYVRIPHRERGVVPFDTYEYQDDALQEFEQNRFNIVLKARQMGMSTLVSAYSLWLIMFNKNKRILTVATKRATAEELVKKVKRQYQKLPDFLKISEVITNNNHEFEFANESSIKADSTSEKAGRSEAVSLLIVDEAAHVDGIRDFWSGVYPTLSTGGSCIILSTPNGVGNFYHEMWVDARAGNNDFNPIKINWDEHPERDQEWFDKETRNMSRREVAQELQCNFNASGHTVIDPDDLMRMRENIENEYDDPKKVGMERDLWVWSEAEPGKSYFLSADVARGDGEDYSAFHVFDQDKFEQVAEYKGRCKPDMYAEIIMDVAEAYNNAMVVVENNNVGFNVLTELQNLGYPNLYYSKKGSHEYVKPYIAESTNSTSIVPGFSTTRSTRPKIVAKLEEFIRNKEIILRSPRTIDELDTFVWKNGTPKAMSGANDDLVMSLAIACWIFERVVVESYQNQKYNKACLAAMGSSKKDMDTSMDNPGNRSPMGVSSKARRQTRKSRDYEKEKEKYKKYGWLFNG